MVHREGVISQIHTQKKKLYCPITQFAGMSHSPSTKTGFQKLSAPDYFNL